MTDRRAAAALLMLFGAVLIAGSFFIAPPAAETSSTARLIPVYCVDRGEERILSISINAADGDADTPAILDVLDKHGVKTTFFLVGTWVRRYPERVQELAMRGHELGNHSDTHPQMDRISREAIEREIGDLTEAVEDLTGVRMTLFRPPSGSYNNRVVETARAMGYEVIQWDVDSLDWKGYGAADMQERVLPKVSPGSIVLFHVNSKGIVEALDAILGKLISDGWKIVPVGELLLEGETRTDHAGRQFAR